jgi:hypothetical protein
VTITAERPPETPEDVPIDYPAEWPPGSGHYGPNVRQELAHMFAPHADEVLYGGARGGGKTDFALAEALRRCLSVPGLQAVFFRRTYVELSGPGGAIPRLLTRIPKTVGRWNSQDKRWTFFNGSNLFLSYLDKLPDVQKWLGLELQLMVFDQVEQIDEDTYVMVRTSLRGTGRVAQELAARGMRPSAIATANPGGRGHAWVKARFVDPVPTGGRLFRAPPSEDEPEPMVRVFVPARLDDNPALAIGDPSYRARLQALGTEDRKAQLEGDWNVFKGARFSDFRTDVHVVEPERLVLPPAGTARRAVGIDYGADHPFVALWGVEHVDGTLIVYREVSGRGLTPTEQAQLVLGAETPEERTPTQPMPTVLDSACWAAPPDSPRLIPTGANTTGASQRALEATAPPDGSIAWSYQRAGLGVRKADKRRLEGTAAIAGRLKVRPDGRPRILISSACPGLISTLPTMQRDPKRPEDYLKLDGDDYVDALRYLVMQFRTGDNPGPGGPSGSAGGPAAVGRLPTRPVQTLPTATAQSLRRRGF